ncbi:spore cortex biosynthesis protein YabQ [Evansella caseinilytica]|uniref:Spore cortex biosynthesis protein YabQ n=1 Tax=Evansella caseinilytica TaxID=1503961 RepID=A0A1H3UVG1_9BACI|nr:spore cortex biosynthesis protein YabQ [Evansella caseinilytica]SDZ66357.1 spore cortex biosynthesis protein YabQ [Evansella caseinilytica]
MTLEVQFLSMLASAGTGIWLGASFDTYKRFLGSPKRFRWTFVINDVLFWILQGLIFFYVLLQVNNGDVRFYLILSLILGYSIYRALFEKLFLQLLEWLIGFCKGTYRMISRTIKVLIITPIKWLLQLVLSLSMILLTTLWNILLFLLRIALFPFRKLMQQISPVFERYFGRVKNKLLQWIRAMKKTWNKFLNKFRR